MKYISSFFAVIFTALFISVSACANNEPIKLSQSGICHDVTSSSYTRTKNYTPFASLETCLQAGGRLPKSQSKEYDEAEKEAIAQKRDFVTLYDRDDWPHWIDSDGDCQDTRHELLISTSSKPVKYKSPRRCNVAIGHWFDPYSGEIFTDSLALDLDHIVPLKFAHGRGGYKWPKARKQAFANDIENLLLVKASLNRQKGAKGPTEWMPPNQTYRCEYLSRFNTMMRKYELSFTASEQRIVDKMMKACGKLD